MAACVGTVAGLVAGLVLAASEPVVIATDAPFPAYTFLDADGTITGFERDLMDDICKRALLTCSWIDANFDQLIPGVMAGDYDIAIGGIAVTAERRDLVDFTQTYYSTDPEEWYIGRPGAPAPDRALIAVQSGTMHEAHVRKLSLRHVSFSTEPEVLAALAEGRVDLALGPYQTRGDLDGFLDGNGLEFLFSDLLYDDGVGMAVCKGNADLLDSLNTALDAIRADGTLETLENRWFQ